MDTEELWSLIKERLDKIEEAQIVCNAKVSSINGTMREHSLHIKAIWAVFGGAWGIFLAVMLIWLRGRV